MLSDKDLPQQLKANTTILSSNLDSSKGIQINECKEDRTESLPSDPQVSVPEKDSSGTKDSLEVNNTGTGSTLIPGLTVLTHQSFGLTPGALGLPTVKGSSSGLTLPSMTSALLGGTAAAAAAGFGLQPAALGGGLQHTPVLSGCTSSSAATVLDSSPTLSQSWSLNQHLNIASGTQRLSAFTSIRPSGLLGTTRGSTTGSSQYSTGSLELNKSSSMSPDGGVQTGVPPTATSLHLHPRPPEGTLSFPSSSSASPAGTTDPLIRMGGPHTLGVTPPTLSAMYHPSMLTTYPDFPLTSGLPTLCK